MPPEIHRLTSQFLHNPERIEAAPPATTSATIEQFVVKAPSDTKDKREALRRLVRTQTTVKNAIIFANRKTTVAVLETSLKRHGFNAAALHGDMDQQARLRTLAAFRAGEITYLIASDVAARGLDIPDVSHVFNFDVPVHAEDYVHRIGRTARAGRQGHAFMLVTKMESKQLRAIEQLIRQPIPWFGGEPATAVEGDEERAHASRRSSAKAAAKRSHEKRPHEKKPHEKPTHEARSDAKRVTGPAPVKAKGQPSHKHPLPDAPDSKGFHKGNMPAFLKRPLKAAETA